MEAFRKGLRFLAPRRRVTAINITPLIDVMFLLLIFMLVTTTFKMRPALKVSLPRARHADPARTDRVTLTVSRDDSFFLDGEPILRDRLQQRMASLRQNRGDRPVVLEVDRFASSGAMVFALDAARGAGYKHIVLPTVGEQERSAHGRGGKPE